jgi:hypothetical protein
MDSTQAKIVWILKITYNISMLANFICIALVFRRLA